MSVVSVQVLMLSNIMCHVCAQIYWLLTDVHTTILYLFVIVPSVDHVTN